jgi:hypothetical protein
MQKVVFKRAIPFKTNDGTILTDTIVVENDCVTCSDYMNVVAIVAYGGRVISHSGKCVFARNTILSAEPFQETKGPTDQSG